LGSASPDFEPDKDICHKSLVMAETVRQVAAKLFDKTS
jgi:hypothetical protein